MNKHLVALRRVLKEAWRLGLMTAEDRDQASDVKQVTASRLPKGHHVPTSVLGALLAMLYTSGVRRDEITGLAPTDYDRADRSLRVLGKRNKQRFAYIPADTAGRLEAWLTIRGREPGALFPSIYEGGRIRTQYGSPARMTGQAIRKIL